MAEHDPATILIAGASRGLGLALAEGFAARGWHVIGTVRGDAGRTELHQCADAHPGRITVETLDINADDQIAALRDRLSGRRLDIAFVNAGITAEDPAATAGTVTADDFAHVMITNVLSPFRVIEAVKDLVPNSGLIGVMSSGQGSIANNLNGRGEIYRTSKAALNMLMRSFAARPEEATRALLLLAPGWIRTALGGPGATFTIEESVPKLIDVLLAKRGRPGLDYLDREGRSVPW